MQRPLARRARYIPNPSLLRRSPYKRLGESYFDTPSLLRITRLLIFVGQLYGELKVGVFFHWFAFSEGVAS